MRKSSLVESEIHTRKSITKNIKIPLQALWRQRDVRLRAGSDEGVHEEPPLRHEDEGVHLATIIPLKPGIWASILYLPGLRDRGKFYLNIHPVSVFTPPMQRMC